MTFYTITIKYIVENKVNHDSYSFEDMEEYISAMGVLRKIMHDKAYKENKTNIIDYSFTISNPVTNCEDFMRTLKASERCGFIRLK